MSDITVLLQRAQHCAWLALRTKNADAKEWLIAMALDFTRQAAALADEAKQTAADRVH